MDLDSAVNQISWQNGYADAVEGNLYDDSAESNKDSYSEGFSHGKEERGIEDYISQSAFLDLIRTKCFTNFEV